MKIRQNQRFFTLFDGFESLFEALIEAKLVPPEQKQVLETALRPGGYADQLAALVKLWALVEEYFYAPQQGLGRAFQP